MEVVRHECVSWAQPLPWGSVTVEESAQSRVRWSGLKPHVSGSEIDLQKMFLKSYLKCVTYLSSFCSLECKLHQSRPGVHCLCHQCLGQCLIPHSTWLLNKCLLSLKIKVLDLNLDW